MSGLNRFLAPHMRDIGMMMTGAIGCVAVIGVVTEHWFVAAANSFFAISLFITSRILP